MALPFVVSKPSNFRFEMIWNHKFEYKWLMICLLPEPPFSLEVRIQTPVSGGIWGLNQKKGSSPTRWWFRGAQIEKWNAISPRGMSIMLIVFSLMNRAPDRPPVHQRMMMLNGHVTRYRRGAFGELNPGKSWMGWLKIFIWKWFLFWKKTTFFYFK